jgi:hypothetical protein
VPFTRHANPAVRLVARVIRLDLTDREVLPGRGCPTSCWKLPSPFVGAVREVEAIGQGVHPQARTLRYRP